MPSGSYSGPTEKTFPGFAVHKKILPAGIARDAGDLRGAGFGELRENAVTVDGEKRAVVAGAGQDAAVGVRAPSE